MGAAGAEPSLVPGEERETAVVVVVDVPELAVIYREAFPTFHALGIPLHVTLLYPFVRPEELDEILPRLADVVRAHSPFDYRLTALRTFPRTVWLAPEPAEPFVRLTRAIEGAFPLTPHWGGAFEEVIPHVTLVDGLEEGAVEGTLQRLRALVAPLLPVRLVADEAVVLAEREDGRWTTTATLPIGSV
jgi:2'-5' RNA ligase